MCSDNRLHVHTLSHFHCGQRSATLWTVTRQASLSMGFPRQEHWSGWSFPSLGDLPDLGIEPGSPALQAGSLLLNHHHNDKLNTLIEQ